jgi:hypothetical protein
MTGNLPTYCALEVSFDRERLHDELIDLKPSFDCLATTKANLDNRSRWFSLGDERMYSQVEHVVAGPGAEDPRTLVQGNVPSWRGVGLTQVAQHPETRWGSSRFRRSFDGGWQWNEALEVPYARDLIAGLGMQRLDNVRVMCLPQGGFGPAHVDWETDEPWEKDGLVSITFLTRDGGVAMRFKGVDDRLHDVSDPVFFFKDCAPHGIPQTSSERLLLRVNGTMERKKLRSLMRLEGAIW